MAAEKSIGGWPILRISSGGAIILSEEFNLDWGKPMAPWLYYATVSYAVVLRQLVQLSYSIDRVKLDQYYLTMSTVGNDS